MYSDLKGKVCVVTGASTGFGRGIAAAFGAAGAKVAVGDLTPTPPELGFDERPDLETSALIASRGGSAIFVTCDVTKRQDVANLIGQAIAQFGRLDIMVNNAGVYRGQALTHELSEDDFDICMNVIARGSFLGSQEAVKAFLRQGGGGVIINIVSTAGLTGHPLQSVYNMAKGAQANLTRCLAIEYGPKNIRVNGICPTYCKTGMSFGAVDDADFNARHIQPIPLQRWGEIEDVANLAVFLGSSKSSFIHGALIPLDGGETTGRYSA